MQHKLTWLRISLFTKKRNWHYLLHEIDLFITKNSPDVIDYVIEFNFLCGENIRLSILTLEDSAAQFAPIINSYFRSFFLNRNLRTDAVSLPVNGIFKPFNQNTIQYGLFDISFKNSTNEARLSSNLSKVILKALTDDEIDDETIITFAFYLYTGILKASEDRSELIRELRNHYRPPLFVESDISVEFLDDKFKNNKQELLEVYKNIMAENQSNLPDWIIDWITCDKGENETGTHLTDISLIKKYHEIISIVNQRLAISGNSWLVISYFLQQTIKACQYTNI